MAVDLILKYFPDLSEHQRSQFTQLGELYRFWNEQVNLVSRQDVENLYERHVLHSLGIAKVIQFTPHTTVLDVGTGGGFPGIPLAILFPDVDFHLVDSVGKKIKVVGEVTLALGLTNAQVEQVRAEHLTDTYDFVVSRAVTRLRPFYDWVRGKFNRHYNNELRNGILYLKGGDLKDELQELGRPHRVFNLATFFEEEFFLTKKVVYVPMI
ncbi:MAG: 16S rRNA (guanine(527)-N(7))-methyltransferase RsmG [Cytophagaceae bacterium]|nr:16S rRNA (guanine(527)-N(7))-methyltransferase RsmG [Cytophagaceae bacterium]